jgi:hypothetical protein
MGSGLWRKSSDIFLTNFDTQQTENLLNSHECFSRPCCVISRYPHTKFNHTAPRILELMNLIYDCR